MANLGFDDEVAAVVAITGSSVGWATAVVALLRKLKSDDPGNPFGTAALKDVGTAQGNLAELGAGGRFDAARLPAASETGAGAVELATLAEARTGTDTTRAVTPAGVRSPLFYARIAALPGPASGASGYGLRFSGPHQSGANVQTSAATSVSTTAKAIDLRLDNSLPAIGAITVSADLNGAYSETAKWHAALVYTMRAVGDLASTTDKKLRIISQYGFGLTSSDAVDLIDVVGWPA